MEVTVKGAMMQQPAIAGQTIRIKATFGIEVSYNTETIQRTTAVLAALTVELIFKGTTLLQSLIASQYQRETLLNWARNT